MKSVYDYLVQVQTKPEAPILAHFGQEIRRLNMVIQRLSPNDVMMSDGPPSSQSSAPKPKMVILVGNDIKKMKKSITDSLPKKANIVFLPFGNAKSSEILNEARCQVLNDNGVHDTQIMYHPGSEECLQLDGDTLIHEVTEFAMWISHTSPTSIFSVISVPQIVKTESKAVNDELRRLSEEKKLQYVPMTVLQSELLRRSLRNYDSSMAERIGQVLARHVAKYLNVSLKERKQKPLDKPNVPSARTERNGGARTQPQKEPVSWGHSRSSGVRVESTASRTGERRQNRKSSGNSSKPTPPQVNLADLIVGAIDRWRRDQEGQPRPRKPYRKR